MPIPQDLRYSFAVNSTLIIRLSSIGDIIQCSAVPRHIKKNLGGHVHWLVRSDNQELVANNPYIDKVISFSRQNGLSGWINLAQQLRKAQYTHVYDAHNNIRSRILCFFLNPSNFLRRSKNRWKRFLLFFFKINLFKNSHSIDSYLEPLKKWGIQNDGLGSEIHLPDELINKTIELLPQTGAKKIAVAPATAWRKKTWPLEYWKSFIQKILSNSSYQVIILGGPKDDFCNELVIDSDRVLSLQGKLSLLESAAVVKNCETLVAADTGLLHMAESLNKDVVAILGPTPFGSPYRKSSQGLQTKIWCQPCSKDGSGVCINPTYQKCMKLIKPDAVWKSLTTVLGHS